MSSRRPPGKRHIPASYPRLANKDGVVVQDTRKPGAQPMLPEKTKAVAQHAAPGDHAPLKVIPGLNRGPYVTWTRDTPLSEQIEHVLEHLDGLPCPGCKDATALLVQFRERVLHESVAEFEERLAQVQEEVDAEDKDDKPFT